MNSNTTELESRPANKTQQMANYSLTFHVHSWNWNVCLVPPWKQPCCTNQVSSDWGSTLQEAKQQEEEVIIKIKAFRLMLSLMLPTYAKIHPLEDDTITLFQAKMSHIVKRTRLPLPSPHCLTGSVASASARGKTASSTLRTVSFHRGVNRPLFYRKATPIWASNHTFHSRAAWSLLASAALPGRGHFRSSDRYFLCSGSSNIMSAEDCWFLLNATLAGNLRNSCCSLSTWMDIKLSTLLWAVGAFGRTRAYSSHAPRSHSSTHSFPSYMLQPDRAGHPPQSLLPNSPGAWANTACGAY